MSHCKTGEKATIKYKFPEKAEMTYTALSSPVEVTVRPITAKNYVFGGYYCEYWVDEYDANTGRLINSTYLKHPYGALRWPYTEVIYPPFEYPFMEWLHPTDFGVAGKGQVNYCYHQWYRTAIRFSNSAGARQIAYFNLNGGTLVAGRQSSECYIPYIARDVTFRRVDGKQDPLKWEINIIDSKQNSFTDYGLGMPTYSCQCGDCSQDSFRCGAYHYPGFNCIPCSSLKSEIAAMRSMVRRING